MPWLVEIHPNANNSGECQIYLRNLEMPSTWEYIRIRATISINELMVQQTSIIKYSKSSESFEVGSKALSFQELQNAHPALLTCIATINILEIKLKEVKNDKNENDVNPMMNTMLYCYDPVIRPKYSFEWKVTDDMLQVMKDNINNRPRLYESHTFDNLWKIKIRPNAANNKCKLQLHMLVASRSRPKLNVRWSLCVKEASVYTTYVNAFSYDGYMAWTWGNNVLSTAEFESFKSLTIVANIQILDLNGSEEDTATKAWKHYMSQNYVCYI